MLSSHPIPRPEYPRPERQRGLHEGVDWLNLNGPWQFRFDPNRRGEAENWFAIDGPNWREQITVPFCWESLAAWGEGDIAGNDNYYSTRPFPDPVAVTPENHRSAPRYEVGWYRRLVEIPAGSAWNGRRAILTIGAADFFTDCWCNGVHLGHHEGGYDPFEYDLTDTLQGSDPTAPRTALLVLRVEDPMDNRQQPVGKQWGWYTPTSGIWQTVFIEPRSSAYIADFRIVPDIDMGTVEFDVTCAGVESAAQVELEITPPSGPARVLKLPVESGRATGTADVKPVRLWDTVNPQLYRLELRLRVGKREVDKVRSYFGMRKIGTAPADAQSGGAPSVLRLNNQPIYLRGALYQSYHPDGVYTAGSAETLYNDIAAAKAAGFDFLRIHIKLDDPIVLYYADTLGILVMQDLPNFGEGGDTPLGRERFEKMLRAGIARDFNHPSIVAWCIFNETWGFGGQVDLMKLISDQAPGPKPERAEAKIANLSAFQWVHEMWVLAKSLDPSRLIEDMSVVAWEHLTTYGHVDSDINSWHFYIDDYQKARKHIANVVAQTYRGSNFNYIEGRQQGDAPLINSEYGGIGALDGDRDISWSFKFLTNELRLYPQLSAYIFTQLTDVEWERNGVLNYDRTRKQFGYALPLINSGDILPINAAPISRIDPGTTVQVEVYSSHFSRKARAGVTLHWRYSGIDTFGIEHPNLARGHTEIAYPHYRVKLARKIALTAPSEPMLCTLWVEAATETGERICGNYIQHFVSKEPTALVEDRGNTMVLRRRVDSWDVASWSGESCTAEEAKTLHRCHGRGSGFFEWKFDEDAIMRLGQAKRLRFACEASSCRDDESQTDAHAQPSCFEVFFNGLCVHQSLLPNHPHDARGSLSYLQGFHGPYGFLVHAIVEDNLLTRIAALVQAEGGLRVRCNIPPGAQAGGLTIYDYDCGRFPLSPTLVIEW